MAIAGVEEVRRRTRIKFTAFTLSATAKIVAAEDANRISITFQVIGVAGNGSFGPRSDLTTANGFTLQPVSLPVNWNMQNDGGLPGEAWYGVAGGAPTLIVLEVLLLDLPSGHDDDK